MSKHHSAIRKSDMVGDLDCPVCNLRGTVDFIDLVRGMSAMHCNQCGAEWKMQIEASMGHLAS